MTVCPLERNHDIETEEDCWACDLIRKQATTVYALIEEDYESSRVLGIFFSLEKAQSAIPGAKWEQWKHAYKEGEYKYWAGELTGHDYTINSYVMDEVNL